MKRVSNICIADLLGCGAANGKHATELQSITGLNNRQLRRAIQDERLCGTPILSDTLNGYYLPGNNIEVEACIRMMRVMAEETLRVSEAIEAAANG